MAIYEAYLPPAGKYRGDAQNAFLNARFVRDEVAYVALFVPFLWLLWNRLWLEAFACLVFAVAVGMLGETGWAGLGVALSFLPGLYVFLEGGELLASKLRRNGWRFFGVVEAGSQEAAERRYFEHAVPLALEAAPAEETAAPVMAVAASEPWGRAVKGSAPGQDRPEIGIFSED